jgi:serine/threonine protein kinase/Tfp pilus assembly protein PilF
MGNESRLYGLLLRWRELREEGRAVSADELCADCPELLAEFRRRLENLDSWNSLRSPTNPCAVPSLQQETLTGASSLGPSPGLAQLTGPVQYRVAQLHARGGLGEVYLAHDETLHRDVALKRIRGDASGRASLLQRFVVEAEVTGRLEHPGVVPVYGLGQDAQGRPYYAMRFVRGETLHDAVARFHNADRPDREPGERALALRQLLARFVTVCNTVAYAHSQGVLHRDLKPANILLGPYGETLVVDWGLAKSFERMEEVRTEETPRPYGLSGDPTQDAVGTPGFMSPEQAAGQGQRVGPASDVYGLGATLYFLLVGQSPFPVGGVAERLARTQQGSYARPRSVKPAVPAALEAVCLKAMALLPASRYQTAQELAQEIEHWLADEPLAAYPDRWPTRFRRRARRHPGAVAGTAALVLATLVALALGLWAVRAEQQRTRAERDRAAEASRQAERQAARAGALNRFLLEDLLGEAAPEQNPRAKHVTVEEVLDKAAGKVEKGFPGQIDTEVDVRLAIGNTYRRLGQAERARPQFERALALCREHLGPEDPETLEALQSLASTLHEQGKLGEAEALFRQALEARRRVLGPEHADTFAVVNNLALVLQDEGQFTEAEPLFREASAYCHRVFGPEHPNTLSVLDNLGQLLQRLGKFDEAESLLRQTLEVRRRVLGREHPLTLVTLNNLATLLDERGDLPQAEVLFRETLEAQRRIQGPDHPQTLNVQDNLATILHQRGELAQAEPVQRRSLEDHRRVLGPDHPNTLLALNNLAALLHEQGKLAEAEASYREAVATGRRVLGAEHPSTLLASKNLGRLLQDRGRLPEAESLLRQTLASYRRVFGPDHPDTLAAQNSLAGLLAEQGRSDEAEALVRDALARMEKALPAGHRLRLTYMQLLGGILVEKGDFRQAEPLLRQALEGRRKTFPARHVSVAAAASSLGAALAGQGGYAEAEPLLLEAEKALDSTPGVPAKERRKVLDRLVCLYEAWGKAEQSSAWRARRAGFTEPGSPPR